MDCEDIKEAIFAVILVITIVGLASTVIGLVLFMATLGN